MWRCATPSLDSQAAGLLLPFRMGLRRRMGNPLWVSQAGAQPLPPLSAGPASSCLCGGLVLCGLPLGVLCS